MHVAIAVVNFRTPELVIACLESVAGERAALPGLKVVVVDNLSGDHSVELLTTALAAPLFKDWVEFLPLSRNGGFGWGNNQAILHILRGDAQPEAILLLNPDTRIEPGAIAALVHDMERRPDAGAIGSQLFNEDGTPSGSAFRFPSIGRELVRGSGMAKLGRALGIAPTLVAVGETGPVDWVTGASVLLRTSALRDAGLFDTGFFLYFEEVELMHRLKAKGWMVYHCPESRVIHVEGASTGVSFDASADRPPPPLYVFASRYRYFGLTGGAIISMLAALSWLLGVSVGRLLSRLTGRRFPRAALAERKALLALGVKAVVKTGSPAIARATDAPGLRPAWELNRIW